MKLGEYFYSPRLEREFSREVIRVLDMRYRRLLTIRGFLREMRRLGFTPTESWILLGEYERGELWQIEFWKSHVIFSMGYLGEHIFEMHIIFPHFSREITEKDEALLASVMKDILIEYGVPENFVYDRRARFSVGEVQTKPVRRFNFRTEASIFDVATSGEPLRRTYRVFWAYETTLTGEKRLRYTGVRETRKRGREALKEYWRRLVRREAL